MSIITDNKCSNWISWYCKWFLKHSHISACLTFFSPAQIYYHCSQLQLNHLQIQNTRTQLSSDLNIIKTPSKQYILPNSPSEQDEMSQDPIASDCMPKLPSITSQEGEEVEKCIHQTLGTQINESIYFQHTKIWHQQGQWSWHSTQTRPRWRQHNLLLDNTLQNCTDRILHRTCHTEKYCPHGKCKGFCWHYRWHWPRRQFIPNVHNTSPQNIKKQHPTHYTNTTTWLISKT